MHLEWQSFALSNGVTLLNLVLCITQGVECEFCHEEFSVINRHMWRCKAKVSLEEEVILKHQNDDINVIIPKSLERSLININNEIPSVTDLLDKIMKTEWKQK